MGNQQQIYVNYGYVYVHKDEVESIRKDGFLSARMQIIKDRKRFLPIVIAKYQGDYEFFLENYKEELGTEDLLSLPLIDRILHFLDWQMRLTKKGHNTVLTDPCTRIPASFGVYFLFAPIPNDPKLRKLFAEQRPGILEERVLIRFHLGTSGVVVNNTTLSVHELLTRSRADWIQIWTRWLVERENDSELLWFDQCPHGFTLLSSGLIDPRQIEIFNE